MHKLWGQGRAPARVITLNISASHHIRLCFPGKDQLSPTVTKVSRDAALTSLFFEPLPTSWMLGCVLATVLGHAAPWFSMSFKRATYEKVTHKLQILSNSLIWPGPWWIANTLDFWTAANGLLVCTPLPETSHSIHSVSSSYAATCYPYNKSN